MVSAEEIQARLISMADANYRTFMCGLLPTVSPDSVLGVPLPQLRRLAGELVRQKDWQSYLCALPHKYLEENHLHSFLIDRGCPDFPSALVQTEHFLPCIQNWAVCDSFRPRGLKADMPALFDCIRRWLQSPEPYTVRFALVLLLSWFLEEEFRPEIPEMVLRLHWENYYVNMAISWFWSTALARQYSLVLPVFENRRLSPWIHRKSIQKAIESRQISPDRKAVLKSLR